MVVSPYLVSFVSYDADEDVQKEFLEYCPACWELFESSAQHMGLYGWDQIDIPVTHPMTCDGCGDVIYPVSELIA